MNKLLAEANRQIGELNAYSLLIPNVDLYIKMHVKIETNKSSRIEGTIKDIINSLLEKNIIVETTEYSRNQIFKFQKYYKSKK